MSDDTLLSIPSGHQSPFEAIRRTNAAGVEYWSSRDFARVLGYTDYRNFEHLIQKARMACFNSAHRVEDHFVDVTEMIDMGSGVQRPLKAIFLPRYACYLVIQNADPGKEIVALGQTYFATSAHGFPPWLPTPTGFRHLAQGCRVLAATLGGLVRRANVQYNSFQPQRGCVRASHTTGPF